MDTKTTEELKHELKAATNIEDYLKSNRKSMTYRCLTRELNSLLSAKKLRKADVVRGSLLSRAYVYQIFSGEKSPSRDTLLALAFGLHLSDEETQALLKASKNPELYAREERDAIILFALQKGMSIFETNALLFEHDFQALGVSSEQ
ncbi:MAG: helix-turn-helix domain-containing protein [Lachnospiraceae bacterium]|nr:helix-turn-helix domain-containing protein [Lachnospiraceae bacterium]